jgi:hypothetical protein
VINFMALDTEYLEIEALLSKRAGYVLPESDAKRIADFIEELDSCAAYLEFCMIEREIPTEAGFLSLVDGLKAAKKSPKNKDAGIT